MALFLRTWLGWSTSIAVTMKELALGGGKHRARDVWAHEDVAFDGEIEAVVDGHSVKMYVVR